MEKKQKSEAEIERDKKLVNGSKKTQWKPGQSGNPHGNLGIVGALKKESRIVVLDIFERCAQMTEDEANARLIFNELSLVEKAMIMAIKQDIKKGGLYAIDRICDRILGKPKERIDVEQKNTTLKIEFVDGADNADDENIKGV
jgi:hypothetical protein